MNRARASMTLGRPRRITQVPDGTSSGAHGDHPDEADGGHDGLQRPRQLQLVGAVLEQPGGHGDAQPRPRGPHVRGVVAARPRRR